MPHAILGWCEVQAQEDPHLAIGGGFLQTNERNKIMSIVRESAGKDPGKCKIYKGKDDKWWWNATARNGQIVAASHQGYVNKSDCVANAKMQGYSTCTEA